MQSDGRNSFEKANEMMSIAFAQGSHRFEWDHKRQNGEVFPVEVLLTAIPFGERSALHVVWRDITERKQVELDLENRTNQLIQNQKVLWELAKEDLSNEKLAFNRIIKADSEQLNTERVSIWLFNEMHTEIVCKTLYQAGEFKNDKMELSADQYPRYFQALAENGTVVANDACNDPSTNEFTEGYLIPLGITSMMDVPIQFHGEIVGIVCHEHTGSKRKWSVEDQDFAQSIADMCALVLATSESRQVKQKLSYQACHDALTGLNNRYEFERRAARLLATVKQDKSEHALCFMDLDQFKVINDTCGHKAGDEMLRQISIVLTNTVRHRDTLARLGGDEFGVLMEYCSIDDAYRVATSLQKAIQDFQFTWEGRIFKIGVSIGLAPIIDDMGSLTDLLKRADASCHMAKEKGRNRIHVYDTEDIEMAQRHGEMQWVARINQALEEDRFCLYAQTIVPLNGSTDKHYELLIRMVGAKGEIIPPDAFLPAAERYNLMSKIDRWVIKRAFSLLANNPALQKEITFYSINLSGQSLTDPAMLEFIITQLKESGINGNNICFEITETAAISNLYTADRFIMALKQYGCQFALDDFGSGLSSFGYLKNLPVDYLKIDGMFVKDIVDDPIDRAMVKSINDIGHVMGMKTIAEYVENDEIRTILTEIGIDYAQGYGVGRPQAIDKLICKANNVIDINEIKKYGNM